MLAGRYTVLQAVALEMKEGVALRPQLFKVAA